MEVGPQSEDLRVDERLRQPALTAEGQEPLFQFEAGDCRSDLMIGEKATDRPGSRAPAVSRQDLTQVAPCAEPKPLRLVGRPLQSARRDAGCRQVEEGPRR